METHSSVLAWRIPGQSGGRPTTGRGRPAQGRRRQFSSVQSLSHVLLFEIPWTVARQAPLSMGFSSQEYWSGLLCPPAGDLPNPGIKPISLMSPALTGRFFTTESSGKP